MRDTPEVRYRHAYGPRIERELKTPEPSFADRVGWAALILLAVVLYAVLAILAAVILVPVKARAHDWYPPHCCSGHDCRRISEALVELRNGGFYVRESRELIGYSDERIKRTPPEGGNFYHRCSRGGTSDGETICLYVPNFGT